MSNVDKVHLAFLQIASEETAESGTLSRIPQSNKSKHERSAPLLPIFSTIHYSHNDNSCRWMSGDVFHHL